MKLLRRLLRAWRERKYRKPEPSAGKVERIGDNLFRLRIKPRSER